MKIISIQRNCISGENIYLKIKFRNFWGKEFTKDCLCRSNLAPIFAQSGNWIPTRFWDIVEAFNNSGDIIHEYE